MKNYNLFFCFIYINWKKREDFEGDGEKSCLCAAQKREPDGLEMNACIQAKREILVVWKILVVHMSQKVP